MGVETVKYLPTYDGVFQERSCAAEKLQCSSLGGPLSEMQVDFSLHDKTWGDTAKRVATLLLQIVIFPWGLYELTRHILQRIAFILLYPAQSRLVRIFDKLFRENVLDKHRSQAALSLASQRFIVRHVVLEKNGVRYSGLMMGHRDTLQNGNWALVAGGNGAPYEYLAESCATAFQKMGFNTLLVNGPAVGRSQGHATVDSLGEAQDLAMRFLETALKVKKLVTVGISLGGAATGQAILRHQFKTDTVKYLDISLATFDRTSNVSAKILGKAIREGAGQSYPRLESFIRWLIWWSDCEMDRVEASRRLQQLGIHEIIVRASRDEVIPAEASLASGVAAASDLIQPDIMVVDTTHNELDPLLSAIVPKIREFGESS